MKFPLTKPFTRFLRGNAYPNDYNDGLDAYLADLGYTGTLADKLPSMTTAQREWVEYAGYTIAEAAPILARLGTDVNVYTPGLNSDSPLNGNTIATYLQSTGVTAATVDNPLGRINSTVQGLGAEKIALAANREFSSDTGYWTKGAGWAITGGKAVATAASTDFYTPTLSIDLAKTYRVTFTLSGVTSGSVRCWVGGVFSPVFSTDGTYTINIQSTTNTYISFLGAAFSGSIDDVSIKEVLGIHATQSTAGSRPTLRNVGGPYSAEFGRASSQYWSLSAVPFQMSDDHAVIVCAKSDILHGATVGDIFSIRSTASTTPLIATLRFGNAGALLAQWRDDAATLASVQTTYAIDEKLVATATKIGNAERIRKNGATIQSASTVLGATTVNSSAIGASVTTTTQLFIDGNVYCVITIKLPAWFTDANLKTLERFAGLHGNVSIS